jgi:hypothetical protein
MNKTDYAIQIIAMHEDGKDIESITRIINTPNRVIDIHFVSGVVNTYTVRRRNAGNEVLPSDSCVTGGLIMAGSSTLACPYYRKPDNSRQQEANHEQ